MANGPTRAELQEAIDGLSGELDEARKAVLSESMRASALDKKWGDALLEIDKLKDELHAMTIENARLEGYRDRVLEFDPVTERQQYTDETGNRFSRTEFLGTPPRTARRFTDGYQADRPTSSWYRRRA